MLLDLVTPLHSRTKRDYMARLMDDKVHCMTEARKYGVANWDGERRYGYGGYHYQPGRFKPMAEALIERYDLKPGDSVLDIGCGKGFLLYELQQLMPLHLDGIERSTYAIEHKHPDLKATILNGRIENTVYAGVYDLVVSLGCLHNLTLRELHVALPIIAKSAKNGYLMVESFRNVQEWFNLTAWCLTAESIMRPEDWCFLYEMYGYKGDYEFIYFE